MRLLVFRYRIKGWDHNKFVIASNYRKALELIYEQHGTSYAIEVIEDMGQVNKIEGVK